MIQLLLNYYNHGCRINTYLYGKTIKIGLGFNFNTSHIDYRLRLISIYKTKIIVSEDIN